MLAVPADLSDVAREKWEELAPQLAKRCEYLPSELLTDLLRQYCEAYATRQYAMLQLSREPLLSQSPNGVRYPSPWFKVIDQCEKTMDRVHRRLGVGEQREEEDLTELDLS